MRATQVTQTMSSKFRSENSLLSVQNPTGWPAFAGHDIPEDGNIA